MGNPYVLYAAVAAIMLIGLAGTLWVGLSRENREGNPAYYRSTKPNYIRLIVLYVLAAIAMIAVFFWFMRR